MNTETQHETRKRQEEQALCRSFIYDILAAALQYPTLATLSGLLLHEKTKAALSPLAEWLEETGAGASGIALAIAKWRSSFDALTLDGLRTSHGYLFGHTARGVVCPYETEYGQEGAFQQPRQLGKIAGFYNAFGLTVRKDERERLDHVSCELEFMAFLARKEAYALEHEDGEMLEATRKASRFFMRDHLGRFGRAFAHLLRKEDSEGFFGRLGEVIGEFITMECARLQLDAGPALLPLRSAEDEPVPIACGESSSLETPDCSGAP